tara:strand:+ start:1399 stop:1929 length:531 start_codon:yes stop_codon:yes gene_type:complete
MSILKITRLGHPLLFQKSKPVNDVKSKEIKKIILDMTETMLDAEGIGLAAPQVHIDKQIIIFRNQELEKEKEIKITALINPKISKVSDETDNEWEGCLSIPGMLGLVKRFSKIKYEGYDIGGNFIQKTVDGLHARVVQHEYDHLRGIMYINRLVDEKSYGYAEEIQKYWKVKERIK